MLIFIFGSVVIAAAAVVDPASDTQYNFKNNTHCSIGFMTTANGAPVEVEDTLGLNSPLMSNAYFLESMSHLVRERIPERIVHAKGAAAFGYFEVTHNITNICKAQLFSHIGQKTRVAVRFSPSSLDKGEADTNIDSRGFAVKFYTEDGNFDIAGFHTPMFMLKDPNIFSTIVRVIKRNHITNLRDQNRQWDFISLHPESVFFFMYLFGDNGIPDGFRYMPGYSIHTYQVYNKYGKSYFVRFHFKPDLGIRNIFVEDAVNLTATDPDYAVRDLYNAIRNGNYPSWSVYVQVLTLEDVKKANFDVFDTTKILPITKYPFTPIGKLVLNRNPVNFFAEVEQLAFCPGNVVPGISGAPDKLFEARRFAYRDAQLYRLGGNFNKIRVNCPLKNILSYDRDGVPPVGYNGGDSPNYYPNSYHGPGPYTDKQRPKLINAKQDNSYSFEQSTELYTKEMTEEARSRMIENIVYSLGQSDRSVQKRIINIFKQIHPDLAQRVAVGLAGATS